MGIKKQLLPLLILFRAYTQYLLVSTSEEIEIIQGVATCYNRLWQIQLDPGPGGGDLLRFRTMGGRGSPSSVQYRRNYENIYQRFMNFSEYVSMQI